MEVERESGGGDVWSAVVGKDHELQGLARVLEQVKTKAARYVRCGARTRKDGSPCQSVAIRPNGRCMWHGGLSTGPRTLEGKARCAAGQRAWWARWRAIRGGSSS
jgi:hypothetical protein